MTGKLPLAIGFERRDIPGAGDDLFRLAEKHGYRWVYTVHTDVREPKQVMRILGKHAGDHNADAIVTPGFEHIEPLSLRIFISQFAALITPMQLYPKGYQWYAEQRNEEVTTH
jgi:hypothetical protein